MPKTFLGVGCAFPVKVVGDGPANGELQRAGYEESVRQSIWLILGTARGERVMRPDFGCGLYDLVFELNSAGIAGKVAQEVRDALLFNEPRIDVLNVNVESRENGETMLISVDYEVRATNNIFNLVYPFYLESTSF